MARRTPAAALPVGTRNAAFQQWRSLLGNRNKRQRLGEFLVQGVRPITLALMHGWPLKALLVAAGRRSDWANEVLATARVARVYELAADLMAELGQKEEQPPEVLAVAAMPPDDLSRVPVRPDLLAVAFDRPASPGNLGTVIRSADALGAHAVLVSGHAADLYDPKTVRATTGSLFAMPSVRVPSSEAVLGWVAGVRRRGVDLQVVGTAEDADLELVAADLRGPTLVVVGNETSGMSAAWTAACDRTVRIPMTGSASSLNAATSASIVLYEAGRQRRS